jgi:hypothetical protein
MDRRREAMTLLGFPPCLYCGGYTEAMVEDSYGRPLCTACQRRMDTERIVREHREKIDLMMSQHRYQMAMIEVMASMDRPASVSYTKACRSETMKSDLEAIMGTGRLGRRGRIR